MSQKPHHGDRGHVRAHFLQPRHLPREAGTLRATGYDNNSFAVIITKFLFSHFVIFSLDIFPLTLYTTRAFLSLSLT
mgnify:CR=1 FL=1